MATETLGTIPPQVWNVIGTVTAAAIAAIVTWWTTKVTHKGKPENTLIDQMQENFKERDEFYQKRLAEMDKAIEKATAEAKEAKAQSNQVERINLVLFSYVYRLRDHIELRKEPPAPDWPSELRNN